MHSDSGVLAGIHRLLQRRWHAGFASVVAVGVLAGFAASAAPNGAVWSEPGSSRSAVANAAGGSAAASLLPGLLAGSANEPVDAAHARAAIATRSSLWANRLAVTSGASVRLTGRVSFRSGHSAISPQSLRGQTVTLQRRSASGWATVTRGTLSGSGYLTLSVRPKVSSRYRLVFAGATVSTAAASFTLLGSHSGGLFIRVTARQALNGAINLPASTTAPSALASRVVALAAAQTGKWYRWGYAGPTYFDCSGLTLYVFRSVGVYLPHNTDAQRHYGVAVSASQARPGDLIIFLTGGVGTHAGIYAGGGYMYDAPHTGTTVGLHRVYSTNVVFRRLV